MNKVILKEGTEKKGKTGEYLEMLVVFIVICVIVGFANTLVSMGSNITIKMVITLLIYIVMTLIPIMIYRIKKVHLSDLGFNRNKPIRQVLNGLGIFAVTICFIILPLLFGANKSDVLSFKSSSIYVLGFYIIYDLFFVGFGEEIIFRGYFYRGIRNVTNSELKAVILSSVLFGLSHYPNGHEILKVFSTAFMGLIYGFARYKIKDCTVLSTSIAHGIHDAVIVLLSFLLL